MPHQDYCHPADPNLMGKYKTVAPMTEACVSVNDVLTIRTVFHRTMRLTCKHCGGEVLAHRPGKYGATAHFQHVTHNPDCANDATKP